MGGEEGTDIEPSVGNDVQETPKLFQFILDGRTGQDHSRLRFRETGGGREGR
jgi:hypothetical protein